MEQHFTIREVVRLTGLPAATLRKWEERYSLITPSRMANGYRGYSRRDILILRWIKAKVDGGALVSVAATELLNRIAKGWDPLTDSMPATAPGGVQAPTDGDADLLRWRNRLVQALLLRDTGQVGQLLDESFGLFSLESALINIIQAALYEIGRLWEQGEISEYQEHYASVLLRDRLNMIRSMVSRVQGPLFLTACLPGELHELGSIILGIVAGRMGYQVVHLGASPSPCGLKRAVVDLQPAVVGLSVTDMTHLTANAHWLEELSLMARDAAPRALLLLGGRGVRGLTQSVGGFRPLQGDARSTLSQIKTLRQAAVWQPSASSAGA